MSCFILEDYNYDFLLSMLLKVKEPLIKINNGYHNVKRAPEQLNMIGNILKRANYKSVNNRYKTNDICEPYVFNKMNCDSLMMECEPSTALFSVLDCYEYQSGEADDYEESEAYKLCGRLRKTFAELIYDYSKAPWGIHSPAERAIKMAKLKKEISERVAKAAQKIVDKDILLS